MTPKITKFFGDYSFLSNFSLHEVTYKGVTWPTAEHAFQAAKSQSMVVQSRILTAETPSKAKRIGRSIAIRSDWDQIKDQVMYEIVSAKFEDPELRERLLATGDAELIEGNTWGDQYWGVCDDDGLNRLGEILMRVRRECARVQS